MTTSLDPARTAVLVMDMQPPFLTQCPDSTALIAGINDLVVRARLVRVHIMFVRVEFRPGYPELSDTSPLASIVKPAGLLIEGGRDAEIDPRLDRVSTDTVVTKHRTSAFSGNELEMMLRSSGIEALVLAGFSTGGVVLSTADAAFDLDFHVVVAGDCCADPDPAAHDFLITTVLPRRATVIEGRHIEWS